MNCLLIQFNIINLNISSIMKNCPIFTHEIDKTSGGTIDMCQKTRDKPSFKCFLWEVLPVLMAP